MTTASAQTEGGRIEGGGQRLGDAGDAFVFQSLGRHVLNGRRDAEHGAQKSENGHGPGDKADQSIAAFHGGEVVVGQGANLVVEFVGGAATLDEVQDRRHTPAQVGVPHTPRLPFELFAAACVPCPRGAAARPRLR